MSDIPICPSCKNAAVVQYVKKDGPNNGKAFYCCPQGCKNEKGTGGILFKWANLPPAKKQKTSEDESSDTEKPKYAPTTQANTDRAFTLQLLQQHLKNDEEFRQDIKEITKITIRILQILEATLSKKNELQ